MTDAHVRPLPDQVVRRTGHAQLVTASSPLLVDRPIGCAPRLRPTSLSGQGLLVWQDRSRVRLTFNICRTRCTATNFRVVPSSDSCSAAATMVSSLRCGSVNAGSASPATTCRSCCTRRRSEVRRRSRRQPSQRVVSCLGGLEVAESSTNVPINRKSACFSGPRPPLLRNAPISVSET